MMKLDVSLVLQRVRNKSEPEMTKYTFLRFVRVSIGNSNVLFYTLIAHTAKCNQKATKFFKSLKVFPIY